MGNYKSDFLNIFEERGFFNQCTDSAGLDNLLTKEKISAYIGFDCTAKSLHVGSVMQIMILRWLQKCGHKPIILLGGATTKIGDPSGKDESRPPLSDAQIEENKAGIKKNFEQFGLGSATFVDNSEWLQKLNYIDFLRDVGRHFSVNKMLSFDSVKLRLEREQNLSFIEFNYMILQAYDFMELAKKYSCRLQIGGSDQWGNIVNGTDLSRRLGNKLDLFGLTTPLMTTSDGKKMGKTASGAVWLSPEMLTPYDYWQFWRNTADADVGRFLRIFTELPISEIQKLESLKDAEINEAKKILATESTKLCHGEKAAKDAEETAKKTFEEGKLGGALPVIEISKDELEKGIPAFSIIHRLKLAESGGEARRIIRGKGGRINDKVIENENQLVTLSEANSDGMIKVSSGKKHHALIKVS